MAKSRSHKEETLASKSGVSQSKLSAKIARVRREDPSLTTAQAAGKASGILRGSKHGSKHGKHG